MIWESLNLRRKQKVEKEQELRKLTKLLAEMGEHKASLTQQSEFAAKQLRQLLSKKAEFDSNRLSMRLNAEVLVKIQQGMVEINESPVVTDLGECGMMHRYN